MKKTIFTAAIVLSTTVAITLYSCKKTDATQPQHVEQSSNAAFNVTASNNRLVFNNLADYEKVVNNPTPQAQKAFLKTIDDFNNFTSFGEQQNIPQNLRTDKKMKDLIEDDYLKNMLNADLCIQIDKHIFRVNPVTEKVYALPVANAEQYNDLVNENISNANIQVFSTDDDVLYLIDNNEEGTANSRKWFCGESGIDYRTEYTEPAEWTGINMVDGVPQTANKFMKGKADFNRYGIYFSLIALVEVHISGTDIFTSDEVGIYVEPCFYKPRCKDRVGPYNTYEASGGGGHRKFESYKGSTNLNELRLRIKGTAEGRETNWVEIRVNC